LAGLTRPGGLWRHPDFLKLWAGQTVSLAGSLISRVALPLVAILTLDASPGEVALLRVADLLPAVAIGLVAGVWADRLRRRWLMIGADLGRALLFVSIPLAAFGGTLRFEQLVLVVLAAGGLSAIFAVAYEAYLPTLVAADELVEGNSKLQASGAVVEVASFGLGGWLVQLFGAPLAVLLDAISFLVSALSLGAIRTPEPPIQRSAGRASTWLEIGEGLRLVRGDAVLRAIGGARATYAFFAALWSSMLLLFLARDLELAPGVFGLLFSLGGVCSFLGTFLVGRLTRRLGLGPTLIVTLFLNSLSLLFVPLAGGPELLVLALVGGQQLFDAAGTIYLINEASLIQSAVPNRSLGRVSACLQVVGSAGLLGGTLAGGLLGETVGPRLTMVIGAVGGLSAFGWLLASPVRRLEELPSSRSRVEA
jgi:predicted MFS family arabinose efflux permease